MTTIFQRAIVFHVTLCEQIGGFDGFQIPRAKIKEVQISGTPQFISDKTKAGTKNTHLTRLLVKSRQKGFRFPTFVRATTTFAGNEVIIASSRQSLNKGMTLD